MCVSNWSTKNMMFFVNEMVLTKSENVLNVGCGNTLENRTDFNVYIKTIYLARAI